MDALNQPSQTSQSFSANSPENNIPKRKRITVFIFILFVGILLGIASVFLWRFFNKTVFLQPETKTKNLPAEESKNEESSETTGDQASAQKKDTQFDVFTDPDGYFSFKFPKNYTAIKEKKSFPFAYEAFHLVNIDAGIAFGTVLGPENRTLYDKMGEYLNNGGACGKNLISIEDVRTFQDTQKILTSRREMDLSLENFENELRKSGIFDRGYEGKKVMMDSGEMAYYIRKKQASHKGLETMKINSTQCTVYCVDETFIVFFRGNKLKYILGDLIDECYSVKSSTELSAQMSEINQRHTNSTIIEQIAKSFQFLK
ncbi:MAG: hypothetical protein EXS68_01875 [Candidatus Ryanbacteria bacterium]|nr:hypothetical protein [Candidatus Ryanbacteria bacterium]